MRAAASSNGDLQVLKKDYQEVLTQNAIMKQVRKGMNLAAQYTGETKEVVPFRRL